VVGNNIDWHTGMPASTYQDDAILIFGGDGTIHRHLGQLVKLGLPILVVPTGSGNDFARALGLRRLRDSVAAWREFCNGGANVRAIDLGIIAPKAGSANLPQISSEASPPGFRYFCCVAGVGIDTEVARRANALPRWLRGHGGYAASLLSTLPKFAPHPMRIQTALNSSTAQEKSSSNDSQAPDSLEFTWTTRSDQPTILAAFANTPTYGGGMKIAPRALMDDGLLDACVISGIDPFRLFCLFPTVYFGRHLNIREVKYFQADRVRLETSTPLDVYADGEYVCRTPVELGVAPKALRVIAGL
jgi:diacylglycerol kinase (ATP)